MMGSGFVGTVIKCKALIVAWPQCVPSVASIFECFKASQHPDFLHEMSQLLNAVDEFSATDTKQTFLWLL